ncbi:hypothetical protein, partial [Azospirillum brasilense]|uniref:hypothetical protein n=1 Tax=Azospirillum brasilense TaxID=192 RepID=UPI001B3BBB8B
VGDAAGLPDGLFDQLDGGAGRPGRERQNAQQVQRVGVARVGRPDAAVIAVRIGPPGRPRPSLTAPPETVR